jgi:DNA-directed RNA polymerase specialized sigma24 family protein
MTRHISPEQHTELQRVWDTLLRHAQYRGVGFPDAQDLVSNALRNALDHFDSARGELLPFSRTILDNAIKNYWRDRKVEIPFEDDEWSEPDGGPDTILEEKERAESMKRTVEQLSALLSADELEFMRMLGQVVDELGDRAVSETARRLGLKPNKGWDLFRRIQRKAHSLETPPAVAAPRRMKQAAPQKERSDRDLSIQATSIDRSAVGHVSESRMPPSAAAPMFSLAPRPDPLFEIAGAMAREEAFERFMNNL